MRRVIVIVVDRAWSPEEDHKLAELVERFGARNWALSESVGQEGVGGAGVGGCSPT